MSSGGAGERTADVSLNWLFSKDWTSPAALALLKVSHGLQNGRHGARPYVWNPGEKARQGECRMRLEAARCWAGWRLIRDGALHDVTDL